LPAAHFSTELFSLAARVRTIGAPVNPEKPHQGVASKKIAPHQAEIARNSTTALGLSWSWWSGTAPGARVTYDYDAFGNSVGSTGTTPNVYRYQGEALDSETGLYYMRARYYDPTVGRFLNVDPMTDKGEHPYSYAAADPVNGHDPTESRMLSIPQCSWRRSCPQCRS
jgi:RHS repeat-associated protein